MPQKRNPVSIEHTRSMLSSCVGDAATVLTMIHNTPFGDIVDTEDDLQPYAWKCLRTLDSVYRLLGKIIVSLEVNKDALRARAEDSFATVTELADTLVRKEGLTFRSSHKVVARLVKEALEAGSSVRDITLEQLNDAANAIVGRRLGLTGDELAIALDPVNFVTVRRLRGGPNPLEVERALHSQAERLAKEQAWLNRTRNELSSKLAELDTILSGWIRPPQESRN
jgi:argininosuccinate lyase